MHGNQTEWRALQSDGQAGLLRSNVFVSCPGSRRDHDRFCKVEQWADFRNARGKKVGHHVTYELELPDGRILRTRVSRPANKTTYGASLWNLILTEQLCVSEQEFWECVSNKNPPRRGSGSDKTPVGALPAQLVHQLIHDLGVPEDEIVGMTLERATKLMIAYWSKPRG